MDICNSHLALISPGELPEVCAHASRATSTLASAEQQAGLRFLQMGTKIFW